MLTGAGASAASGACARMRHMVETTSASVIGPGAAAIVEALDIQRYSDTCLFVNSSLLESWPRCRELSDVINALQLNALVSRAPAKFIQ